MRIRTKLVTLICLLACCSGASALSCLNPSKWSITEKTAVREMYNWYDVVALVESAQPGGAYPPKARVTAAWKGYFHDSIISDWLPWLPEGRREIWFAKKETDWSLFGGGWWCTRSAWPNSKTEQLVREMFGDPTIEPTAYWIAEETAFYSILFLVLLIGSLGTLYTVTRGFKSASSAAPINIRILSRHGARAG